MDTARFWENVKTLLCRYGKTQKWLAGRLGISAASLSSRMNGGTRPEMDEMRRIACALDVDVDVLLDSRQDGEEPETFLVPLLDQTLSAGKGGFLPDSDEVSRYIEVPRSMRRFGRTLAALHVKGDSMMPTLNDGDTVLCDCAGYDGTDGIYALRLRGSGFVKRLKTDGRTIRIISDNPEYEMMEESAQSEDIEIMGRVHCVLP